MSEEIPYEDWVRCSGDEAAGADRSADRESKARPVHVGPAECKELAKSQAGVGGEADGDCVLHVGAGAGSSEPRNRKAPDPAGREGTVSVARGL